jgi:hypothetical protein
VLANGWPNSPSGYSPPPTGTPRTFLSRLVLGYLRMTPLYDVLSAWPGSCARCGGRERRSSRRLIQADPVRDDSRSSLSQQIAD